MGGLVKFDIELIAERVRGVLSSFPQVAGAYLYGSILGDCRPDSDIDLALILEAGIKPDGPEGDRLEAEISMQLPPIGGHSFDLFIINPEKPLFAFKPISQGKLIYSRNQDRVTDVIEYVSRRYADLYPRYRQAMEEIFAEVVSGGH